MSQSPPAQGGAPAPSSPGHPPVPALAKLAVVAVVVGLVAGAGASVFVKVEHELMHWLWTELPQSLGQEQIAWWLVIALLVIGALLVLAAERLPGHGGHTPLHGLGVDIGPRELASVVLAALGSLSFGAVLGPEAPLMAVGSALGALAIRQVDNPVRQVMMLSGAVAAVGAIFGNPLVTSILLLELAVFAGGAVASLPVLLAALCALASGYVLQVGFADWSGLGEAQLALPSMPAYDTLQAIDLLVAVPLAVAVAAIAVVARLAALEVSVIAKRAPLPVMVASAAVVALAALAVRAITGGDVDLVLFSGQSALPDYMVLTSISSALVIGLGKLVAYIASLGSGFRGGPIFPGIALGVILATVATLVNDSLSISALMAASIAAATAGVLRIPFTAVLLGAAMTAQAGGAVTELAILGAVVGLLTRLAAEAAIPSLKPGSEEAPAGETAAAAPA